MDGSGGGGVAKRDEYEKALHFFNWTPPPLPPLSFPPLPHTSPFRRAKQGLLSAFPTEF